MGKKLLPADYVQEKITALRLEKGISEYRMSYELGHSRGYINSITSGRSLPSMPEFLCICDYFNITPEDFFRQQQRYPVTIQKIVKLLEDLPKDDLSLILNIARTLSEKEK